MVNADDLGKKYQMLAKHLDERALRLCFGADALCLGYGGASVVARAAGVSRTTVHAGMEVFREKVSAETTDGRSDRVRIRKPGGGRKAHKDNDAKLLADLDRLLDPVTRGDPMAPLRWTAKSTTRLAEELRIVGHEVSQATIWRLLDMLGYSMQSNRKSREGTDHPDRNAQFEYIGVAVKDFLDRRLPAISGQILKRKSWSVRSKTAEKNGRRRGTC